jgi:hypothetical protein
MQQLMFYYHSAFTPTITGYDEDRFQPFVKQGPVLSTRPCKCVRALLQWSAGADARDLQRSTGHNGYDQKLK